MAKVISFSIQKGGVAKTTTCGITAHLLAEKGHRVLVVDMDNQGNATELFTRKSVYENSERTILEGIQEGDVSPYILRIRENLHLVPADDMVSTLSRWIFTKYKGSSLYLSNSASNPLTLLANALAPVHDQYDYILIDTPPSLNEQTSLAMGATTDIVIPFEPSQFTMSALPRFLDYIDVVRPFNPVIKVAGVLRNLTDQRRGDVKDFNEKAARDFSALIFDTVITRKAATARISLYGLEKNPELADAVDPFRPYLSELEARLNARK